MFYFNNINSQYSYFIYLVDLGDLLNTVTLQDLGKQRMFRKSLLEMNPKYRANQTYNTMTININERYLFVIYPKKITEQDKKIIFGDFKILKEQETMGFDLFNTLTMISWTYLQ